MSQKKISIIKGNWRNPKNSSAEEKGGIHDDETAQELGLKGGTIPGSVSMEQFVPLLIDYFGESWWKTGGMSVFFDQPVFDNQRVRCILEPDTNSRAKIWMENDGGNVVVKGTACLNTDQDSEISRRLLQNRSDSDLRMLANVVVGRASPPCPVRITDEQIEERLENITEPMNCYTNKNPFPQRVAPIAPWVHAFRGIEEHIIPINGPYVGMFGAIEVQYLNGPVMANTNYVSEGEVIALSSSPKTEIVWYAATLSEADTGRTIARMTKMDRLLKSASTLWTSSAND